MKIKSAQGNFFFKRVWNEGKKSITKSLSGPPLDCDPKFGHLYSDVEDCFYNYEKIGLGNVVCSAFYHMVESNKYENVLWNGT